MPHFYTWSLHQQKFRVYLDEELIEGFPLVGESSTISAEEALKFSIAPNLIQFGTIAPMAIFHYGDKTYYHMMQDPTQVQASETKKARKHAATKARRARRAAISEARKLLKTPEILPVASSNKAHSPKAAQPAEAKVLEALNDAAYHLSWSVSNARSRNNENALRNYRRKRSQVKRLHADLSARVSQNTSLEEKKNRF